MRPRTLALLLCLLPAEAAAAPFLSRLPDVPLMAGLTERPEAGFLFDNPVGRIVESEAGGAVDAAAVSAFYHAALPELGWQALPGRLEFAREDERLAIDMQRAGRALTLRFTITPLTR